MQTEEAARARVFFRSLAVIMVVLEASLPFLPGADWLRAVTSVLAGAVLLVSLVTLYVLRLDARWTPRLMATVGIVDALLGVGIIYYLGTFSAAAAVFTVGVYFFGLGSSRGAALAVYLTGALLYLAVSAGIALGVVPDESLFSASHAGAASRWYRVAMMQLVFGMTFYLARSSRRATETAVSRAQQVRHVLKQRDAQLNEARHELDWALRTGEGYMSGQAVGKYQIEELVGRGGMGEVYAASDRETGRKVALKLLHPNMVENQEYVQRFLREAQAAAAVPSEHVAEVFEVGLTPYGGPFIAMELLEGHDLAWYLRRTPSLPLDTVITMVEHAARALAAVRQAGVVHRDLKPANLFLVDSLPQKWKVLDFGLSKIHGGAALTREVAVGTPQYMPPEQAQGLPVDHRADLYALGAIAYRGITGQPPFVGDDIGPLLLDVIYTQPQQPGAFTKIPVEIELVLAIALAKKPEDRFPKVEDFAAAMRAAAAGALDDATSAKGWQLVKLYPWGSTRRRSER
ncbi:MAG: serine/threonine protein kinase [Polyangiaceae bacterium]|nr:serine/threonine protein kinase [Polyangiaceae bacterium]